MAEPGYYPKENIIVGSKQEMPAMTWLVKWLATIIGGLIGQIL